MAQATLLNIPDDAKGRRAFTFDHAMAHRALMAVMGPLHQWSVMPYFIDPASFDARPADKWSLNHQQAHNDFNAYLPAYTDQTLAAWTNNPGIPTSQILIDSRMKDEGSRQWWTFINHQEHLIATNVILPLQLTPTAPLPPPTIFAPLWWLRTPRLAATYW